MEEAKIGSKSDFLETTFLNQWLGGAVTVVPTIVYVALFTATPTDSGGGSEVGLTGTGYTRAVMTNNVTNWPTATGNSKSNGAAINFGPALTDWGTITGFAIFDAATAGNMLWWAALTTAKAVGVGDSASFPASSILVTED